MAAGSGRVRLAAALLAASLLAACTGTPEAPPTLEEPPTPAPSQTPSDRPDPVRGPNRLRLQETARVPLHGLPFVVGVRLVGQRVLFAACADCSRPGDVGGLHVHDLRTGRTTRVATTRFSRGVIVPLGGSGDKVVWQDLAPVAPQVGGRTQWRLQVLDLGTRRTRILAGTTATTRSAPPWAVLRNGVVAWQDLVGDSLAGPVQVADLATGVTRVATPNLPGPLSDVTGRALLYIGASPPGTRGDVGVAATPADAYALPLDGGPPTALSTSRDVGSVTTDGTTAVWTSPRGPATDIWAAPVAGGQPRLVYRGRTMERVPGRGFVAVLTSDDPVLDVAPLGGGRPLTLPDVPFVAGGLSTDGPRLAWVAAPGRGADADGAHPLQLVVAEVR